jgi:arylsulfatase A-like enzyme
MQKPHANKGFTDAHSPSAVCTPTRYGLLTGRYAWCTHLKRRVFYGEYPMSIKDGRTTIQSILKKERFATAGIGKWYLGLGNGKKSKQARNSGGLWRAGQLYNSADCPSESNNLYTHNPEKLAELKALLKRYQEQGQSRPFL